MKFCYLLCLFFTICYFSSFAQVQEDFADGDFSNNPIWTGNTTAWTVVNGQLRSNSAIASSSFYLSTPSSLVADTQWEVYVKLAFNTSGTNYVDIFLTSDKEDLKSNNNGYFVRIGGTRDEISLYKRVAGTNTLLIDGADGITNVSSSTLKIKVTSTPEFTWILERDITGTGNSFVTEGTKADASFTTSTYFGIVVQQSTSSFHTKHFFDDIKITPIDREPPLVKAIHVLDATHVEVLFSKSVTEATAKNVANYLADQAAGNPASVAFATTASGTDASRLILTFANEFISELPYSLSIRHVEDLNKNQMLPQALPFQYKAPFTPQYRDIVINELMADPTPVVDLPEAEFIELYNSTSQEINLNGYTLTDGSSTAKFGNTLMAPYSFLIVCSTTYANLFTPFGKVAGLSNFPSLNNSGETLMLKNPAGKLLDKITYSLSWYKDAVKDDGGWTLEQINPLAPCNNSSNWQASSDVAGGTPGKQNALYSPVVDQSPPALQAVKVISTTQLEVQFTETMDSVLVKNGTYTIDPSLTVAQVYAVAPEYTSVKLILSAPIEAGKLYTITISGLADCPGNPLPVSKAVFGTGKTPGCHQLLITEILADESPKVGLPEAEFIEVYNPTDQLLSLAGVTFTDDNATVKLTEKLIYPKQYLLLCASAAVEKLAPYGNTMSVSSFSLNNSGEQLMLRNSLGHVIHAVKYSPDWYVSKEKADGGWSLEMVDLSYACVESGNWLASDSPAGGTPGKANSVLANKPDLKAPELLKVSVENPFIITLLFNEKLDSANASIPTLYTIAGHPIRAAKCLSPQFTKVQLTLAEPLLPKKLYKVTGNQLQDCSGNIGGKFISQPFALPEQADSADIIINEVLFNSRTGGADFVELYNRTDKYINLKNWQLANISNDSIANLKIVTAEDDILAPDSYKVLTTNMALLKEHYPKARLENSSLMKSMPSFPDEAGNVILLTNLQKISDRFDYTEKMHFSLLDDVSGVSLERISPDAPTNNVASWHSAASTEGYATPGYRNSQLLEALQTKKAFSIYPQVFTPDDDGQQDFTTFSYLFNQPGTMASLFIYDAQGREVRELANNVLLSTEGFFSWDGTNQRGEKVTMGRYIVYLTVFDMQGKKQAFKETVVVGSKF
ncbi:lamin tail domain-containing protein [Rhodocytophaga aerolata]|uniref:Lamin tail domain-containing protein n=1 Tax=Rhodocytophaga aerolata TaxID=455078 RepID=A0ABT8QY87_9BACT|nr:lamin tail domain-containing protein [Rhodocytophaga aerolata]MDO1444802.1 lamin tail domain-containing protein [Rhodocytophaga aerolata]